MGGDQVTESWLPSLRGHCRSREISSWESYLLWTWDWLWTSDSYFFSETMWTFWHIFWTPGAIRKSQPSEPWAKLISFIYILPILGHFVMATHSELRQRRISGTTQKYLGVWGHPLLTSSILPTVPRDIPFPILVKERGKSFCLLWDRKDLHQT